MAQASCIRCGSVFYIDDGECPFCPRHSDEQAAAFRQMAVRLGKPHTGEVLTVKALGPDSSPTEVGQRWAVMARMAEIHRQHGEKQGRDGRGRPAEWLSLLAVAAAQEPEGTTAPMLRAAAEEVGLDKPIPKAEPERHRKHRYHTALSRARKLVRTGKPVKGG